MQVSCLLGASGDDALTAVLGWLLKAAAASAALKEFGERPISVGMCLTEEGLGCLVWSALWWCFGALPQVLRDLGLAHFASLLGLGAV